MLTVTTEHGVKTLYFLYLLQESALWSHWVIVFGYESESIRSAQTSRTATNKKSTSVSLLYGILSPYGNILEYAEGAGNWTFFRFASILEAARCVSAMNGAFVTATSMLGKHLNGRQHMIYATF
jgi:hypothetical protein